MKWLPFNFRGLASPAKKLAFHKLFNTERVDVNFLPGTLGLIDHIIPSIESLIPGCQFHALDVCGRSGGIALGFNP